MVLYIHILNSHYSCMAEIFISSFQIRKTKAQRVTSIASIQDLNSDQFSLQALILLITP